MAIWTVTPSGTYLDEIRANLDVAVGTPLDYDGTIDGAWTSVAAELAWRLDQGIAVALSTTQLATAPEEALVAQALEGGLTPRAATSSRYIVRSGGAGELPEDTQVQGGGPLGRSLWRVVDATATVALDDEVTIEAVDTGAISLPSTATLTLISPVAGITTLTYDSGDGDAYQVGRAAESAASLRLRVAALPANGGSAAAVRSQVRDLSWVVAADVQTVSAGTIGVTVAPGPVGADQEDELGQAIYGSAALGIATSGTSSTVIEDVNGASLTVNYTEGGTDPKAVVVAMTSDGTVDDADLIVAATAAIEAEFGALSFGDPIYRLRLMGALDLPGATGVTTLTVGGSSAASVSPATSADVLTASSITVTVT
jgi:hypothetical protein